MRGASRQDWEKSLARTGVPSLNLLRKGVVAAPAAHRPDGGAIAPTRFPVTWLVER
jgi:hypothetical protein